MGVVLVVAVWAAAARTTTYLCVTWLWQQQQPQQSVYINRPESPTHYTHTLAAIWHLNGILAWQATVCT